MSTNIIDCPKCRNRMEEGFTLDETYGAHLQSVWVAGKPEKSFWTGVKLRGNRKLPMVIYRCTNCGYLESYARNPPPQAS